MLLRCRVVPGCPCLGPHSPRAPASPAGEFAFWLGPTVDVLPYYGPVAARAVMHDHELWLHPSSLDGRGLPRSTLSERVRAGPPRLAVCCCALCEGRPLGPPALPPPAACLPAALPHSRPRHLPPQVPKPDVVLTSYEAFTADAAELKAITWEAVVLDERHPWQRAALAKAHTALCDLSAR